MTMGDAHSDDDLLAELAAALAPPSAPDAVVQAALAAYTWRTVDAELAALAYDSSLSPGMTAGVRGAEAALRTLTFQARQVSIEIEVDSGGLVGLVIPSRSGTVEVHAAQGIQDTVDVDDVGAFAVRPLPTQPFRLAYRTADGVVVTTRWVTL
jgi:hypothetical protein